MGLLDLTSEDLSALLRNATSSRNDGSDADGSNDWPSWLRRQQQLAPLSLAGPGFITGIAAARSDRGTAAIPLPRPRPLEWPAPQDGWVQPPTPRTENLTVRTLRQRGVPDAFIAAAIDDPGMMQQLLTQTYRPDADTRREDPAGRSEAPANRGQDAPGAHAPSWGDIGADVARSGMSGLEQSAIELAGMGGDIRTGIPAVTDYLGRKLGYDGAQIDHFKKSAAAIAPAVTDYVGDKLGIDPNRISQFKNGVSSAVDWLPTSDDVRSRVESVAGPLYEPKTEYGRVAHKIGEYGSAVIAGPEAIGQKILTRMVAPALASEGAGYLTKGSQYEPAARIAGAAAGAWRANSLAKEIENARSGNPLRELNNQTIIPTPLGYPAINSSSPKIETLREGIKAGLDESKQLRRMYVEPDSADPRTADRPRRR